MARGPKPKPLDASKRCNKCGVTKDAECFRLTKYKRMSGSVGVTRDAYCKECLSAKQKADRARRRGYEKKYADANREARRAATNAWFHANKERVRLRLKDYRAAHPEIFRPLYLAAVYRKREKGFDRRKKAVRDAITECLASYRIGDLYWDVYESRLIEVPTVDHIQPLALGGTNVADNLCVTNLSANSSKNDDLLVVWLAKRAFLEAA